MGNSVNCCAPNEQGPISSREILTYENIATSNERIEGSSPQN